LIPTNCTFSTSIEERRIGHHCHSSFTTVILHSPLSFFIHSTLITQQGASVPATHHQHPLSYSSIHGEEF
jgi:hypothetical protein